MDFERKLLLERKKTKFAWAKYYGVIRNDLEEAHTIHTSYTNMLKPSEEKIPQHIINTLKNMAEELKHKWECPICLDFIETNNLEITNCGHYYCKECLKTHIQNTDEEKWKCCVCRKQHNKN